MDASEPAAKKARTVESPFMHTVSGGGEMPPPPPRLPKKRKLDDTESDSVEKRAKTQHASSQSIKRKRPTSEAELQLEWLEENGKMVKKANGQEAKLVPLEPSSTKPYQKQKLSLHRQLLGNVLNGYNVSEYAIHSFNLWINVFFPEIIDRTPPITWKDPQTQETHTIQISNGVFGRPHEYDEATGNSLFLTPFDARFKANGYASNAYYDFLHTKTKPAAEGVPPQVEVVQHRKRISMGALPVMLRSQLDNMSLGYSPMNEEPGGTYIVANNTKVIPPLSNLACNRDFIFDSKDRKYLIELQIRALSDERIHHSTSNLHLYYTRPSVKNILKGGQILFSIPYIDEPLPVGLLFLALECPLELISLMCRDASPKWYDEFNEICDTIRISCPCKTTEEARVYIANVMLKKRKRHQQQQKSQTTTAAAKDSQVKELTVEEKCKYVMHTINNELLPQQGGADAIPGKCNMLGQYIWRMMMVVTGRAKCDPRDHTGNKGFQSDGYLFANLFRQIWTTHIRQIQGRITRCIAEQKAIPDFFKMFNERKITGQVGTCMKTSNWAASKHQSRPNVVQLASNVNDLGMYSHLSRMQSMLVATPKHMEARQVQMNSAGRICPSETPEGKQCGLIQYRAAGAIVSTGCPTRQLVDIIMFSAQELEIIPWWKWGEIMQESPDAERTFDHYHNLYVNGMWLGKQPHRREQSMIEFIRVLRRTFSIYPMTSVWSEVKDNNRLIISSQQGMLMRPVIIADQYERITNGRMDLQYVTLNDLFHYGIIEYLESNEEEKNCCVALDPEDWRKQEEVFKKKVTHIELHKSLLLGISASLIPHPECNQSPRITYQTSMAKASVSPHMSEPLVAQKTRHQLLYAQRPLINTAMAQSMGDQFQSMGQNVVLAVCPFKGMTIEDALVVNQDFIDRGGMISIYDKAYRNVQHKQSSSHSREIFERPSPNTCTLRNANYNKLDVVTGIPPLYTVIYQGDAVIGKTCTIKQSAAASAAAVQAAAAAASGSLGRETITTSSLAALKKAQRARRRDASIIHKGEPGIVIQSLAYKDSRGLEVRKVVLRSMRVPEIGDKLSSRHGQKGTISLRARSVDMPFSIVTGMSPDVIINPISFCSRMTIAQPKESIRAKALALKGSRTSPSVKRRRNNDEDYDDEHEWEDDDFEEQIHGDATAFEDNKGVFKAVSELLRQLGLDPSGNERLRNGETGELIDAAIFMGLVFYQRLKHMTADKMHARASGPKALLTRQPLEGRASEGGLRFGEMERDALLGYGMSEMLYEKLLLMSDPYTCFACKECGYFAICNFKHKYAVCKNCGDGKGVRAIRTSYAFKLLCQELQCLGIMMKFNLEDSGVYVNNQTREFSEI